MTKISSMCLYYISFTPLWFAILFIDIKNIINQDANLGTEILSVLLIVIVFIISFFIIKSFINDKRKSGIEKFEIQEIEVPKDIAIEYFLAYVLPLFAFDFTLWNQTIIFLIFYISLGFLCIKHNYFTANIVLEVLKYNFYKCALKNIDGVSIEKYVISKSKLIKGNEIYLRSINNEYMIEIKDR